MNNMILENNLGESSLHARKNSSYYATSTLWLKVTCWLKCVFIYPIAYNASLYIQLYSTLCAVLYVILNLVLLYCMCTYVYIYMCMCVCVCVYIQFEYCAFIVHVYMFHLSIVLL